MSADDMIRRGDALAAIRSEAWPEDGTYPPEQHDIEEAERATVEVCEAAIAALPAVTPEAVAAILKDVTPAPWENDGSDALFAKQTNLVCIVANNSSNNYGQNLSDEECAANARFVVWARNNVETLAADLARQTARADALALAICGGEDVPGYAAALAVPEVRALVEAAKEMDAAFYSNGNVTERHSRACKAGVKLDAALRALAALRQPVEHVNKTAETEHDAGNVLTAAALRGEGRG